MEDAQRGNEKSMFIDPWGTNYRLAKVGDKYESRSAGPDKKFDTADDIVSH